MRIQIDEHALERLEDRGATLADVREAILHGEITPARKGGQRFRLNCPGRLRWNGIDYAGKQVEVIAFDQGDSWLVITVIVRYLKGGRQ